MGVMFEEFAPQARAVQMDVDFGGGYRLMAGASPEWRAGSRPFEQMGGERMSQRVWRHFLLDACGGGQIAYYVEDHHPRQRRAASVQEEYVAVARLYRSSDPLFEIVENQFRGHRRHRYEPLLAPFSFHY